MPYHQNPMGILLQILLKGLEPKYMLNNNTVPFKQKRDAILR